MKSFIKFLITIIVLCVVGYTTYFLVINKDIDSEFSGESINLNDKSGEVLDEDADLNEKNEEPNVVENSGEAYGESNVVSGEESYNMPISKADQMKIIDEKANVIRSSAIISTFSANLPLELVSESAREFMRYFKLNELSVTINTRDDMVEIIPDSDFLENMIYYYNENGELILFESVSNTVGGSSRYYFNQNNSVEVVFDYDEDVENNEEYVFDVLVRGNKMYDMYLKR